VTAVPIIVYPLRSPIATSSVRRLTSLGLGLVSFVLACTPGDPKDGLGPDETAAATVTVSSERSPILVGEAVLVRASAQTSNGHPAAAEVDWTADGGTLVALTDSTAQFSAANSGSYKIRGRGKKSPNPQDSTIIVVNPPPTSPIVSLSVSPNPASVPTGGTQIFAASATRQDGSTLVPSVTWMATGGTIDASGVYTAGAAVGSFNVSAALVGGTLTASVPVSVSAVVSPIVSISVSPATASVNSNATKAFTAGATRQDGSTLVPSVTWLATGGTINAGGVYTAGTTSGTYRVIGVLQGGTLADTSVVTIPAPLLQAVILTPASVTLNSGATRQFAVSGQWSNGATTAPSVTYSATGGTITSGGLYTAGGTAGTFRVIATQQGGTLADTATVTITAPVLQAVILTPASVSLTAGGTQQFAVSGQWSNGATTAPAVTYAATGGTVSTGGLYTAGATAGSFRVIATQQGGTLADTATVTIGGAGGGTILLSEAFEDGNLATRAWFGGTSVATAADARPGSTGSRSLEWHWTLGSNAPHSAARKDFTPSNTVYLSYWVKQSANWIGSGVAYHPHMFQVLTTADDHWIGPSRTHLTVYQELLYKSGQGGSHVSMAAQDALNIDTNNLLVDLTYVTEQRAIAGYNGRPEPGLTWNEYNAAGEYMNAKMLESTGLVMTDATKNSWHHVESYWQLNSISGGRGQPDGVMQTWFDGVLVVDRHDIYFRTNANPTLQFRTFMLGPWIGDGSPRDQSMWIDDLVLATAKP